MGKNCFDQLKNIEVPEKFIKAALDIPYSPPPKKHSMIKISVLSGAAAVVLMLLVGITLFTGLFTPRTSIAPKTETTSQSITDSAGNVINHTENTTDTDMTYSESTQYSEQFSESGETIASERIETATAESTAVSAVQTESAKQPQTESTSVPVSSQPQTQPQTEFSEPCTVQVTENTNSTSQTVTPVTKPDGYFLGKLGFVFMNEAYKAPFRCTITSSDGTVYGGEMTFSNSGGLVTVLYNPLEHGEHLRSGNYTVCFYQSNSRLVLKESFTAVSNSSATFLFSVG